MGLDGVELLMAVEEEFQIALSDSDAAECKTVRNLVELVHSRLRHTATDPCPSQHSFYLVRQNLVRILKSPRQQIKPDTKLEEIIPKENRKKLWNELITVLADGKSFHHRLVRPKWMINSMFPAFFLFPCILFKLWFAFPFSLALISSLPVYIVLETTTRLFGIEFPPGMSKVKDLVKLAKSLDSRAWSEDEVFKKIRAITAEQLGIAESLVTLDARFIADLGLD